MTVSGVDLHVRLLADAERFARHGRRGEAFVLLRWASRVVAREAMPLVLLSYQRVRVEASEAELRRSPQLAEEGAPVATRQLRGAGIAPDAVGLPVPRFPTRTPSVDSTAFVPVGERVQMANVDHPTVPVPRRRGRRSARAALVVGLAALGAGAALRVERLRPLTSWLPVAPGVDTIAAGEAALAHGDPRRALVLTSGASDPSARLRLVRARAFLAIGDTVAAAAELNGAATGPATPEDRRRAGEALGRMGHLDAAADAYLRALEAGLPPERWHEAGEALERAGRREQAGRLRSMLRSVASGGS